MRNIFDEYGSIIIGTTAAALLLILVIQLVFGGEIYNAILEFSRSIC